MVTVKNFSIKKCRDRLRLEFMCSSSKFKEKIIKFDMPAAQIKSLIRELQKAAKRRDEEIKDDVKYIG